MIRFIPRTAGPRLRANTLPSCNASTTSSGSEKSEFSSSSHACRVCRRLCLFPRRRLFSYSLSSFVFPYMKSLTSQNLYCFAVYVYNRGACIFSRLLALLTIFVGFTFCFVVRCFRILFPSERAILLRPRPPDVPLRPSWNSGGLQLPDCLQTLEIDYQFRGWRLFRASQLENYYAHAFFTPCASNETFSESFGSCCCFMRHFQGPVGPRVRLLHLSISPIA